MFCIEEYSFRHLSKLFLFCADGLYYYGVRILTGTSFKFSLYDIHITLVGDKATMSGHDRHTHFGKKYSWHDDLLMESDEDLGQVEVVTLKNKNLMRMQQHIQFVEVHDFNRGQKRIFPLLPLGCSWPHCLLLVFYQ